MHTSPFSLLFHIPKLKGLYRFTIAIFADMILYFIRKYIKCHTDIRWLFYMYYLHKLKKLIRFYMERCNSVSEAVQNAIDAFDWLYDFNIVKSEEFNQRFKELFGEDYQQKDSAPSSS